MLNRYLIDVYTQVWGNIRISIRETCSMTNPSIWFKFILIISRVFTELLVPILNYIYDQIFIEHCDYESLIKIGRGYKLYPISGETTEEFRTRIRLRRILLSIPPSTILVITIFDLFCDCDAEIIKTKNMTNVFTIGVTPIGVGKIVSSNYLRFTYKVILPDLSAEEIDRDYIKSLLDEVDPVNEVFIYEDRVAGLYQW